MGSAGSDLPGEHKSLGSTLASLGRVADDRTARLFARRPGAPVADSGRQSVTAHESQIKTNVPEE